MEIKDQKGWGKRKKGRKEGKIYWEGESQKVTEVCGGAMESPVPR